MALDEYGFDASLWKSDEQVAREQAESEARTYELWERVYAGLHGYGIITEIKPNGIYRFEGELRGNVEFFQKKHLKKAEQLPPKQRLGFYDCPMYKVGDVVPHHGHNYKIVRTGYTSDADVADAEDANDIVLHSGYWAEAELI